MFFNSRAATASCIAGNVAQHNHRNASLPQSNNRTGTRAGRFAAIVGYADG
ncbi:MAG: hypothetical protein LBQ66_09485 [Planctomycetaceae bacterium]|nr:hypothetical protein [Planctomycetaceae bacterium]